MNLHTYKTSLRLIRRLGGGSDSHQTSIRIQIRGRIHRTLAKTHAKKRSGRFAPGGQGRDPGAHAAIKHTRNTHESSGPTLKNDQHLNAITNHRSESKKLELSIGTAARMDRRTDDDRLHKFVQRALATLESSRACSFDRTHAHNATATETEIDVPIRVQGRSHHPQPSTYVVV